MRKALTLSERIVLEKDLEDTQAGFQLLRGLEKYSSKPKRLCLLDVCQGIIDEETFPSRLSNFVEQDLKDLRFWFCMANFARNHHIVE
jgi:hypothetical protein